MERTKGHDWKPLPGEPVPFLSEVPPEIAQLFQRMAEFDIVRTLPPESIVYQHARESLVANGAFVPTVIQVEEVILPTFPSLDLGIPLEIPVIPLLEREMK